MRRRHDDPSAPLTDPASGRDDELLAVELGRTEAEYEADQATLAVLRRGRREPPLAEQVHAECRRDDVDESGGLREELER